ncbi:amidohydrolase family protein [Sphingomonas sp. ASV193]|uniref:amidohydrolase family protein n=1 Tax=Sphingomonas sp. ASV193 TaxID=3144405 RepID=UPI0032E907AC
MGHADGADERPPARAALIDAHQHFWRLDNPGHQWPGEAEAAICRDYLPADFAAETAGLGVAGSILVQAQPTDRDTDWLLDLAEADRAILGVVGWVDFASPDAPRRIADLAARPKLKGLRPMLQAIDDSAWVLRDAVAPAVAAMYEAGLCFDALVQPRHLPALAAFAARWPGLPIVIDHGAKPHAAAGTLDPWRDDMARLADAGCWCKLSGLRTEQAPGQSADSLAPYVDALLRLFGDRLMWGSDWPVLHMAGDRYADWLGEARRLAGAADAARLFGGAAAAFYGVAPMREAP